MQFLGCLGRAAPSTIIFRGGWSWEFSSECGNSPCASTTTWSVWNGSTSPWIVRWSKLRWAGKKTGPNPTDRGKLGSKRSVLVDGRGVPLSCEIAGANENDAKLAAGTLRNRKYRRRRPKVRKRMHLHADKGYDSRAVRETFRRHGYIPKIAKRRRKDRRGRPVTRRDPFRWLVEASHSWQNQFRGIKTRWEKKAKNYAAQLHVAFAMVALRMAGVFG